MKGVAYEKSRKMWRVRISINKKRKHLGYFKEEKDAIIFLQNFYNENTVCEFDCKCKVCVVSELLKSML